VYVSFTELVPREGYCDDWYYKPLAFKVRPKEKGKPTFEAEEYNMVNISFLSTTGCSITVYCSFAQDPVEVRL
jgi:hypothetical protein